MRKIELRSGHIGVIKIAALYCSIVSIWRVPRANSTCDVQWGWNRLGDGKASMQAEPFSGVAVPLEVEAIAADPVEASEGSRRTFRRDSPGSGGSVE